MGSNRRLAIGVTPTVSQDSAGWTVEARIPLDQLRFGGGGDMEWGVPVGERSVCLHR